MIYYIEYYWINRIRRLLFIIKEGYVLMNMEDIKKAAKMVVNPVDPLNIYLDLFDLFKMQNMKAISGDNFVVSNGILQCQNYFIPLDSICIVEMARIQLSPWFFILILVFGLFLSICNVYLYNMYYIKFPIAIPMFIFGLVLTAVVTFVNTKLPYTMTIRLNNNNFCTYTNRNKEFIQKIMDKMQECINNRKGEYKFMLNQGKIEYKDDHSINIGGAPNSSIEIYNENAKKEISGDEIKNIGNAQNSNTLTLQDWMTLEKYFTMRQKEFSMNDRNYKICSNLITYSRQREIGKFRKYLGVIGKEAIRTLFTASTNVAAMETVRPIVQKILSLKG